MLKFLMILALTAAGANGPFDTPESAYWDQASKSWFVSNVAGAPPDKDGRGWISRLDADGKVTTAHWVEGLNAPKGIRSHNGKLYVSDIDRVAVIDIESAKIERFVDFEGARFLNDVAIDRRGNVYISDMLADTIYRLKGGTEPEVFLKSADLEAPNGLLIIGGQLVVAAWGRGIDPATFATKAPGRILLVDLKTREIKPFGDGRPIGNLDGIERQGGNYLVTDYIAGKLFRVHGDGSFEEVRSGLRNGADFGFDPTRRLLAIPEMGANNLIVEKLPGPKPAGMEKKVQKKAGKK